MQRSIKILLLLTVPFLLSGCVATAMGVASVAGVTLTAQEIEEQHNGSLWSYTKEKAGKLYDYVEKKANEKQ